MPNFPPESPLGQLQGDKVIAVDVAGVVEDDRVRGDGLHAQRDDGPCSGDPARVGHEGVRTEHTPQNISQFCKSKFKFIRICALK